MKRRTRIHFDGAVYHVTLRGVDGTDLVSDDVDRNAFIETMNRCAEEASAFILGYCLTGSRIDLAIKVAIEPLSSIMRRMLPSYCKIFNRRHDRSGHLFNARYEAVLYPENDQLAKLIAFISMNPVNGGGDDSWRPLENERWTQREAGTGRLIGDIAVGVAEVTGISVEMLRSGNRRRSVIQARLMVAREAMRNGYLLVRVAAWLHVAPCTMTRYVEKLCKERLA